MMNDPPLKRAAKLAIELITYAAAEAEGDWTRINFDVLIDRLCQELTNTERAAFEEFLCGRPGRITPQMVAWLKDLGIRNPPSADPVH
jgi:hypothetical protein